MISIKLNHNEIYIRENFSIFRPQVHIGITDPYKAVFVRTKADKSGLNNNKR